MKIGIVIGSVRSERKGEQVAKWVEAAASERDDARFEVLDLRDFDVPLFTSPVVPAAANRQYDSPNVTRWSQAVDGCDGFVFVTPEYNHGVPGAFKNAVDSLGPEWTGKTVGFVAYGADGGVRAVEQWRQIVANFQMIAVRAQVSLSLFADFDGDSLALQDRRTAELTTLFDQITTLTSRLS
ncbi:NADPH-dependent FMN reductase [Amycolatopsis endophytica]|uniref:NAD(P)H-dependent FMN reductase n=1 Tax=Amycolatopsis endophytica TaxID=860233 RepID=A0A853B8L2_9PSEU|nr:NAD(P)H-dependent oxidoreductase [Amycolatopsis endophytica]NYI91459.1 NAD(P)H-dependent FMN reductase [Amycolatopsis endophytica]